MGIVILLLKILGIFCYIIAAIAAIVFVINFNEKGSFRLGCTSFIIGGVLLLGGVLVCEYADKLKIKNNFYKVLDSGSKEVVEGKFKQLSYSDQNKYIEEIFNKFYNNDIQGLLEFIDDYGTEQLNYIEVKKKDVEKEITTLYNEAEVMNTNNAWYKFFHTVSGTKFLELADSELKEREFSKWENEEKAWSRVSLTNSTAMYYEFLSRYPSGMYSNDAKKVILDNHYNSYSSNKPPYKITSNFGGMTTLQIKNKSSIPIIFSYNGTFEKGEKEIFGNGYVIITIPNGYYNIKVYSRRSRTRGDYSLETFSGGEISLEYFISQER